MEDTEIYLLDANVFIEASRRYYAFDIAPTFWDALIKFAEEGKLVSIDKVKEELLKGHDELSQWTKKKFAPWFKSTHNDSVFLNYKKVISWADTHSQFTYDAKKVFYDKKNADTWLVAYALQNDRTVIVTQEVYKSDVRSRIPIPNICKDFGIDYINTFEMLRRLNFKF